MPLPPPPPPYFDDKEYILLLIEWNRQLWEYARELEARIGALEP